MSSSSGGSGLPSISSQVTIQGLSTSQVSASSSQLPQSSPLAQLGAGTVLEGFVLNRGAGGEFTLRTAQGDVTLQSQLFLKTGAQVSLRIERPGAGVTQANILTIDKRPFVEVAREQQAQQAARPNDVVATTRTQATQPSSQAAVSLFAQALLLETTDQAKQQLREFALLLGLKQFPSNAKLDIAVQQPKTSPQPPNQNAPSASPSPTPSNTPPPPPQGPSYQAAALSRAANPQVETELELLRLNTGSTPDKTEAKPNTTPQSPQNTPLSGKAGEVSHHYRQLQTGEHGHRLHASTPGNAPTVIQRSLPPGIPPVQLQATVIGQDSTGDTLLRTNLGTMLVSLQPPPTKGSELTIQLLGLTTSASAGSAHVFNRLDALLQQLTGLGKDGSSPHAAQLVDGPRHMVPKVGPSFANDLLFLMSALRSGNADQWLGAQAVRELLQNGHDELVNQLRSEFQLMRGASGISRDESQWQSFIFPYLEDDELRQGTLHYRKEQSKDSEDSERFTRFVIELSLTVFGLMQLDGLIQKRLREQQKPLMDVAIRMNSPLPHEIEDNIRLLYNNASELGSFEGSVRFHYGEEALFVLEQDPTTSHSDHDGILT